MDIITCIITKIGELLVEPTGRQLGYMFCYEANIKALVDETKKLKEDRDGIQMSIDAATRNLEVIAPSVNTWVSEVDKFMNDKLGKFLEEYVKANKKCFNGWCPNLKLQHSLGRKAKKYAEVVLKLQEDAKPFNKLSHPAPPTGMHFSLSSMKDFNSRRTMLKQVMEALRNKKINVIAICGMGGIGKTTMAKEVAKRAKDEKIFGEVVMATVSQNPNVHQIQGNIADLLGFNLLKETVQGRAIELHEKIRNVKKDILLILDDMWDGLDLEAVGIPNGSESLGCKILLTSRSENVSKQMKSQETFTMEVLSEAEAMNLFEEVAGISIETCTPDLYEIARKVANECKGLPVAIVTVGGALKNRDEKEWKDALHQLQNSIPDSILEMDKQVYPSIELSYNFLRSEEAKSCFLLCCLFPEDHNIGIETLVRYGKGLKLFEQTDRMEEATNRVYTLVQNLKRCFLLMDDGVYRDPWDTENRECVKMHDIIRDVAISIAKKKEHGGFIVRCGNEMEEWAEIDSSSEMEDCTAFSLVSNKIKNHPHSLACPNLNLLRLVENDRRCKIIFNENFFKGMKELKVLDLQWINIESLPASLQNLRTLHLEYCDLGDISTVGGLVMLEILSLRGSVIKEKELPKEIGNLQHLKVLDMTDCWLERIPPGVLSSLTSLEELKIYWCKDSDSLEAREEKTCASVAEIIPLFDRQHLKVLNVYMSNGQIRMPSIMNRFQISLCLTEFSADAIKDCGIRPLLKKCGALKLIDVSNLKNLFPHFDEEEEYCFSRLKCLLVEHCCDMEYLVKFTSNNNRTDHLQVPIIFPLLEELELSHMFRLKGIFHYNSDDLQLPPTDHARLIMHSQQYHFPNLNHLQLSYCYSISYVFSASSLARGFPQLQRLVVLCCSSLEEIVSKQNGETDDPINTSTSDDMIVFPKLTYLTLDYLPSLISLCRAIYDDDVGTRSSKDADEGNTNTMNPPTKVLVPFKCIKWLPSLQYLTVRQCYSIRVLFSFHGDDSTQLAPVNSTNITNNINIVDQPNDSEDLSHNKCCLIGCLPCSTATTTARKPNIIQNSQEIINTSHLTKVDHQHQLDHHKEEWLKNLEELKVENCSSLEVVFDYGEGPSAPALNNLKRLKLNDLQKLLHIWKKGPQQVKSVGFQNLKTLSLESIPSLRYLFTASIAKLLVMLESLQVVKCKLMEVVVAKKEEEINNVNVESYVVSFRHLVSIELNGLDNLFCFCQQPYAFEFLSLETLEIRDCPKLMTFVTAKTLEIPKLKGVKLNEAYLEISNRDLNGTIRSFEADKEKLRKT